MKRVVKNFNILRDAPDTSDEAKQLTWAYATVEVVDTAGDIIRVDGISYSAYHNPPQSYLKVLPSHQTSIYSTGMPAVIGRVEKIVRTEKVVGDQSVPALAFGFSWATDGERNVTPLAQAYRDLFEGGYMDSFSVGLVVKEWDDTDTGIDVKQSEWYEVSACSVPMNAEATAVVTAKLASLGIQPTPPAQPTLDLTPVTDLLASTKALSEQFAASKQVTDKTTETLVRIETLHASLLEKLDELESVVVVAKGAAKPRKHSDLDPAVVAEVARKLEEMRRFMQP